MYNKKAIALLLICLMVAVFAFSGCAKKEEVAEQEEWKPDSPIQFIVPYAAGGAIDRVTRALQPHLEEYLGVPVAVVNMPGGSTVIAYEHVYNSKKDGHTVLCLSPESGTMAAMGHSELTPDNWIALGITASFANNFVVHPDSPYKTLDDLIEAMKAGKVTAGCAANGGAWSQGAMLMADLTGANDPEFVPQGGGFVAAQAAMKKEVDFATCGVCEVIDLLAGGELRALAYYGAEPYKVEGYGEIPSILDYVPEAEPYVPFGGWTGLAVPEGTPENIVRKLQGAYEYAVEQEEFKKFLEENAFLQVPLAGEDAQRYMSDLAKVSSWMLYDRGYAKISPDNFGIERP